MEERLAKTETYQYDIPPELIAQEPASPRDESKLMILDRRKCTVEDNVFKNIDKFFEIGDVLVLNNTRVIRSRIFGNKTTGGKVEILLLRPREDFSWECLVKASRRLKKEDVVIFQGSNCRAVIEEITTQGTTIIKFRCRDFSRFLNKYGKVPLPPYIKKELKDARDYQTVYSSEAGAIAAPTAGLHFTPDLLKRIEKREVKIVYITLHCGLATFRPIKTPDIREHDMQTEWVEIGSEAAGEINFAKERGKRIIAVGTTSVRSLESAFFKDLKGIYKVRPFSGPSSLYITPGYDFKIVDCLITNFHTPSSTNLVLVSSFAGTDFILKNYRHAQKNNYRFFSFGDAMLII
ncbi:MAG: tRNA preQ1(34) S-adenosylmethionine ribosyltransferase-isomerase QueA [Candidatus Omnitrophica bacterium]|nr:tRNA preQ1(34) S-adenosylmethionine ribosyltransferase-isomerase QueA [Candidatus Omnitrophota bacterium]MBD3268982.1 tRNA preQ1(34) S-adenosylmethionine ribosyltransferase-isomerase QueA [Candidatus Omnitrophota bacterium]